ncbi:hypothetical protein Ct61P_14639 [Colletotrichum tofieldiae]|nr:hypothetical protein Ct61P_14639 [Colletotrichum tofieldiae]
MTGRRETEAGPWFCVTCAGLANSIMGLDTFASEWSQEKRTGREIQHERTMASGRRRSSLQAMIGMWCCEQVWRGLLFLK